MQPDAAGRGQPRHAPGLLFILSAPSGAGKSTLCRAMRQRFPDLRYSVSFTTRKPRKGEKEGIDYRFIATAEFERRIAAGQWAEYARVHDHYYGTSAEFLDRQMRAGQQVILEIDVQGAAQILCRYPDSVTIFIMPPSMQVLEERLAARGTDPPAVVAKRLANARREISRKGMYRHVIVNDDLATAIDALAAIIAAYRPAGT